MAEQSRKRTRAAAPAAEAQAEPTFGAAVEEVERILARLEGEEVDVDHLGREVRRAVELIGICRRKLAATETEVREYVDALQAGDDARSPGGGGDDGALPF